MPNIPITRTERDRPAPYNPPLRIRSTKNLGHQPELPSDAGRRIGNRQGARTISVLEEWTKFVDDFEMRLNASGGEYEEEDRYRLTRATIETLSGVFELSPIYQQHLKYVCYEALDRNVSCFDSIYSSLRLLFAAGRWLCRVSRCITWRLDCLLVKS